MSYFERRRPARRTADTLRRARPAGARRGEAGRGEPREGISRRRVCPAQTAARSYKMRRRVELWQDAHAAQARKVDEVGHHHRSVNVRKVGEARAQREQRRRGDDERPALVIAKVNGERVQLRPRHRLDDLLERAEREEVARRVEQHAAVREARRVAHCRRRDGVAPRAEVILHELCKRLEAAQRAKHRRGGQRRRRAVVRRRDVELIRLVDARHQLALARLAHGHLEHRQLRRRARVARPVAEYPARVAVQRLAQRAREGARHGEAKGGRRQAVERQHGPSHGVHGVVAVGRQRRVRRVGATTVDAVAYVQGKVDRGAALRARADAARLALRQRGPRAVLREGAVGSDGGRVIAYQLPAHVACAAKIRRRGPQGARGRLG